MAIPFWPLLGIGALAGIFMGLFGIGGGAIMVPAMVLLLGLDQKFASGTSLAAQVLPIGLLGATGTIATATWTSKAPWCWPPVWLLAGWWAQCLSVNRLSAVK